MSNEFKKWLGKTQTTEDEVSLTLVRRAAAMSDMDPLIFQRGSELPPHWYSMFFTPNAPASQIGPDGHPQKGDFLPPIPLPRRMFVGREVNFIRPLLVGDQARKISEIAAITPKQGRSGKLVFVQVKHTIEINGDPSLVELQNIIYREPAIKAATANENGTELLSMIDPADYAWSEPRTIEPIHLFRYSALTWNGHRIHYDADYARSEEGYPGCVMNGALTVHWLIDEALRHHPDRKLSQLKARLSSPLFMGDSVHLCGSNFRDQGDASVMDVVAVNKDGKVSASVELHLKKTI